MRRVNRSALALLLGILLGIVSTFAAAEIGGGWYTYEIRPANRCQPISGPSIDLDGAAPVPNQTHPCLFRRPRFSLIH